MIVPDICLDTANIEMLMPIVLLEQFHPLQLKKISSTRFRLHYNVLVSIEVKELQEDFICYNAIPPNSSEIQEDSNCFDANQDSYYNTTPPNSSEIPEDSNCYEANQDSYISRNPEPLIKYAAASSSSMQHKLF